MNRLNQDIYEKILEKVVELEVDELSSFVSLRGTKWNCRNDCHGVQAFYAITVSDPYRWFLKKTRSRLNHGKNMSGPMMKKQHYRN